MVVLFALFLVVGSVVPRSYLAACLARYHWTADAAGEVLDRHPAVFGASGGFYTSDGHIQVTALGTYFCPTVEHEYRHAWEYDRYGPPPWQGLRDDLARLAGDGLHTRAADVARDDLTANPTDDWHLSQWLLDGLGHNYGQVPAWYGERRIGYAEAELFSRVKQRVYVPQIGA